MAGANLGWGWGWVLGCGTKWLTRLSPGKEEEGCGCVRVGVWVDAIFDIMMCMLLGI